MPQLILILDDLLLDINRAADWPFLLLRVPLLVDPLNDAVLVAKELVGLSAVVPEVLEIEFLLAVGVITFGRIFRPSNQFFRLGLGGQLEWGVASRIYLLDVDAAGQEALEHSDVAGGGSLMQRSITILVDVERGNARFQQQPNNFVEALVARPVQR